MKKNTYVFILLGLLVFTSCLYDELGFTEEEDGDLTDIPYNPQAYVVVTSSNMEEMEIPADNPLTMDGVQLGRRLFYDPILSADSTMSCSSCHFLAGSFTDTLAVSTGIDGIAGNRSSMSLLNVGYFYDGLFWDGRAATLEEQALLPVEDPIELHNTWPQVIDKLKLHDEYPAFFRKAFGIENTAQITKELAAKALASFERILVSSGQSKFDLVNSNAGGVGFTDEEFFGRGLFIFEPSDSSSTHPGCSHCHNGPLLTDNTYRDNGIEPATNFTDYSDIGYGEVTGDVYDYGKFRVPSLKNIELTAPYMHDGRFETLEEVIDHYATGGHVTPNISVDINSFVLTEEEKGHLLSYIKTFTDTVFVNNPDLQNPF